MNINSIFHFLATFLNEKICKQTKLRKNKWMTAAANACWDVINIWFGKWMLKGQNYKLSIFLLLSFVIYFMDIPINHIDKLQHKA
jgi:hypothetical protein